MHIVTELEERLFLTDGEKKQINDYVLLMLGAPVVSIELDPAHLDFVVREATEIVNERITSDLSPKFRATCVRLVQAGALIHAKLILGRIRAKFENPPGPRGSIKLDGKTLVKEATEEMSDWKDTLEEVLPL